MTIGARLREERRRLAKNQTELASIGGVQISAQTNYENDKRAPDADYLAAIAEAGADIQYIVTGQRGTPRHATGVDEPLMMAVLQLLKNAAKAAGKRWTDDALMRAAIQTYNDLADSDTGETQLEEKIRLVINNR